ncbi:MAG TPA: DUF1349 domain-containing protein, partial [Tepidisphaeraceae bacterium]|nr:DUF1349 domain-containing protein [Tepidisphaeraceae bacterium]
MTRHNDKQPSFAWDRLESRVLLAAAQSDDFHASAINSTRWTFVNPIGDGTVTANGTHALISVPGGKSHDVWTGANNAARLMQAVSDENFELEVKFESRPDQQYEMQGLLAEASPGNYLRFDFLGDGAGLQVFAASVTNGVASARISRPIDSASALYMRVTRQGNQWTTSYSYNGSDWDVAGTFAHALPVSKVGVFAGNAHGAGSPAFTASVDYFFNTASPILLEDGQPPVDSTAPRIQNVQRNNASNQVQVTWQTDDVATGVVEYGLTEQYELGSVAQPAAGKNHTVTLNLDALKNYHFRIRATNASNLQTTSGDHMVRSGAPVQSKPVIDVWHGPNQSFGGLGQPQRWVNIIGRVRGAAGISSLTYSLNGSAPVSINPGANSTRLENNGDFNIELPADALLTGANTVVITARDSAQQVTTQAVTVNFARGNVWPRNYTTNWSGATNIGDVAQVVDGLWSLSGDGVRTVEMGYDRLIAIGDVEWQDYEVTVPFTMHATQSAGIYGPPGIGILTRWSGHYGPPGGAVTNDNWWPIGGLGWFHGDRLEIVGNAAAPIAAEGQSRSVQFGTRYIMKMRVESVPGENSTYSLKMWQDGTPEPTAWTLTGSGVDGELTHGSILLLAHHTDATFGRATITQVMDAPAVISNVQSHPRATQSQLTWQTNEPATAVVDYGKTGAYELGSVQQPTRGTSHAVTLL